MVLWVVREQKKWTLYLPLSLINSCWQIIRCGVIVPFTASYLDKFSHQIESKSDLQSQFSTGPYWRVGDPPTPKALT